MRLKKPFWTEMTQIETLFLQLSFVKPNKVVVLGGGGVGYD